MDVPLYAIALIMFAVLYLAIGVFLAYVLLITLLVMFLYLVLRYPRLPDEYPYGQRDSSITLIFIGVTWSIFTFLGPKSNGIPFIGSGLTYGSVAENPSIAPVIIIIGLGLAIGFLVIFSFLGSREGRSSGGGLGAEEKPKQGVGA